MMKFVVALMLLGVVAAQQSAPGESSRCYYYCAYKTNVYCCGRDDQPIPESHDEHDGRCPIEKETVCKDGDLYLSSKAVKTFLQNGDNLLVSDADSQDPCASDGYCSATQKCCANQCKEMHTCMEALYDKQTSKITKKKFF